MCCVFDTDFTILLTDIKERRFERMVDVIKAAGAVIDVLREMLPPQSAAEIIQQLDTIDAQLMSSLRQTALKCVFDDAATAKAGGVGAASAGGNSGKVGGAANASSSSSSTSGSSSSGSDDENGDAETSTPTTVPQLSKAPEASMPAKGSKKSAAAGGRSTKQPKASGGRQKLMKTDNGDGKKKRAAGRKPVAAGGEKKPAGGKTSTQGRSKRLYNSAVSVLPVPTVAAPRFEEDDGTAEDAFSKRPRLDVVMSEHAPSPPVIRDAEGTAVDEQQQQPNDAVDAAVAE